MIIQELTGGVVEDNPREFKAFATTFDKGAEKRIKTALKQPYWKTATNASKRLSKRRRRIADKATKDAAASSVASLDCIGCS